MSQEQEKPKKPLKLAPILMFFLTLSVIFSILAYGYGSANATKEVSKWYDDNFETIAANQGYTLVKLSQSPMQEQLSNLFASNITLSNLTTCNSTNGTICETL